ncbi:MAG: alpha/beta hydrolase [Alkalispirochaeta sp.]
MAEGPQTMEPLEGFSYVVDGAVSPAGSVTDDGAHSDGAGAPDAGGDNTTPPLFLLHGTGGDEYDLLELGRYVAPRSFLVSARGRAPEGGMNRWFARHAEGVLDVADIIRRSAELATFLPAMRERHGISGRPLWALGFSNGANMAAAMLLRYPEIFAGAILMRPMLPLTPTTAPDLSEKPILVMAGTEDTMIPGDSTRELIALLGESGADLSVNWAQAGHRFGMDEVTLARKWFAERAG